METLGHVLPAPRRPAIRRQDLRLHLQEPRRPPRGGQERRRPPRRGGLPRPHRGRRPLLREARELRGERGGGHDGGRDRPHGRGPPARARALRRRRRARGAVPRRGGHDPVVGRGQQAVSGAGAYAGRRPGRTGSRRRARGRLLATVSPVRLLAVLPPRFRRRLTYLLAACLVLAAGYQFWLRDSSLVAVEDVAVTGLTTKDAPRLRAALASAARTMTTLHVERSELERAIAAYPVVRELEVHPDFPNGLQIHVVEHRPAALVDGLPVARDGTILRGLPVEGKLPTIDPAGKLSGDRLTDAGALHAAHVAGAAPGTLRPRLEQVGVRSGEGIVVE